MATEVDLNRWREAGKEIGRKIGVIEERKRIIDLLQEYKEPDMKFHKIETLVNIDRIIALIKGENE